VMVGRKRLGDDGITWPEGGNINMMHGDSRVMVVVCLETASLPAPCLSTSTSPRSREEPFFMGMGLRMGRAGGGEHDGGKAIFSSLLGELLAGGYGMD
ncbi:hypothetical protein, partial [Aeromonas caviae]|uniref:hypothetical protein n=1 Tax=Aeromonas caviae TaxID=648 RepID=UPI001FC8B29F